MAKGIEIKSREYKLLLAVAPFAGTDPQAALDAIWQQQIKAAVGPFASIADAPIAIINTRHVQFHDTSTGDLAKAAISLRIRAAPSSGAGQADAIELTAKLRVADLFVAALSELPGTAEKARSKLEEDIAPLATLVQGDDGRRHVVLAEPRSMRSRFSRSTRQTVAAGAAPVTLGDAMALYPTLGDLIARAGAVPAAATPLVAGPLIQELVLAGPTLMLNGGATCELVFSLWHRADALDLPIAAELSFTVKLDDGRVALASALAAHDLFVALQTCLADIIELRFMSKTVLALPASGGTP